MTSTLRVNISIYNCSNCVPPTWSSYNYFSYISCLFLWSPSCSLENMAVYRFDLSLASEVPIHISPSPSSSLPQQRLHSMAIFLYYCPDCPHYTIHLNSIGWAIEQQIKKYSLNVPTSSVFHWLFSILIGSLASRFVLIRPRLIYPCSGYLFSA